MPTELASWVATRSMTIRIIADHCKDIEERRGELCKLLHPNRAKFEEEGWPGDPDTAA